MKKIVALCAFLLLALGGAFAANSALAVSVSTSPPPATYVTAVWSMPSWVNSTTPTWDQHIVSHTDEQTITLNVAVPTTCGTQYQVDVYYKNGTTTSLISGGVLHAPNNPAESLVPGGWGVAYKLVKNEACTTPTPTPTPTTSSPTPTPTPTTSSPTPTPTVSTTTPTPTPTPTTSVPSTTHTAVVVAAPKPPAPPADELASTGVAGGAMKGLILSLLVALGIGGLFMYLARRRGNHV